MASTAVTPSPIAGAIMNGADAGVGGGMTPSQVKSIRISAVMDRLSHYTRGHVVNDAKEFVNLSLSLARGIDFAVASREVPDIPQKLPSQLKQICQWNCNDTQVQASIMVLMISVKNACLNGWFLDRDSEELVNLTKEIAGIFGSFPNSNTEPSFCHPVISTIMSRFYPRLKMGHTLVFLEAKPGFDAYVNDFLISKNLKSTPGEKLRLFVVQTDSIETSSCLVSPTKVNFLLNGKSVERRTNAFMDTGPQIPTVVQRLKYGSNLLQAIGEFNGNYIIAVALMSELPNPESNVLQDYVHRAPATLDSDADVIEGPSRISLNCPISFSRIKTPAKGHSCNHIQCFDFDNYVDMNSRRPSWRCPHCNQSVCFTDIRIDKKMVKILKEVGPKVTDIVISSDWSWKTATEIDDSTQKPDHTNPNSVEDNSQNPNLPSTPVNVLDLTETDDFMDDSVTHEAEDTKINPNESSVPSTVAANHNAPNTSDVNANQSNNPHMEDDFWSGVYLSIFGGGSLNVQPTPDYAASPSSPDSNMASASVEAFHGNSIATTPVLSGAPSPNALQLYQFGGNPAFTNEYGMLPQLQPSNITRTPIAVQALPAVQMPPYSVPPQQRSRNNPNNFVRHNPSTITQASPVYPMNATIGSHAQVPKMSMPPNQYHSGLQPQRNPSYQTPNQAPTHAYRTLNEHHNPNQQQQHMANIRIPQAPVQSPGSMQPSPNFTRAHSQVGSYPIASQQAQFTSQQAQLFAAANMAVQMSIDPSRPIPPYSMNNNPVNGHRTPPSQGKGQRVNPGASSEPVMRSDSFDPPDPNWRPAGRMRGALTGQAYSDAMNQFIIRPTQQAQAQAKAARPPNHTSAGPATRPGT